MGGRRRAASERTSACLHYDGAGKAVVATKYARPFGDSFAPKGCRVSWIPSAAPISSHALGRSPPMA